MSILLNRINKEKYVCRHSSTFFFFFSSRSRHTRFDCDWSSDVCSSDLLDMRDKAAAAKSPLAERLFDVGGVSGVFFGADFIAVTKTEGEWQQLKPAILGAIMEHFMSGAPIVRGEDTVAAADADEFFAPEDPETVTTIKELIETRVRPAVANDGGDITFRGFKDGVVY